MTTGRDLGGTAFDVVGVGATCVDHVCRLPMFPRPDSATNKIRMHGESRMCGGQTGTALATCARLGLRATYVGAVGRDEDGARIRAELAARGIDVSSVVTLDVPTATATILIDDTGERLVLWHRDPALCVPANRLPADVIRASRLVHVDDVDPVAATEAARVAHEAGIPVTCDIDHITTLTRTLLALVSHPVFAEQVPLDLTGVHDQEGALRAIWERYHVPAVVTIGERGSVGFDGERMWHAPAFTVEPVDTTGAGDVFRAGYIYGLLQGWQMEQRLRFANATAAVACTRLGAMGGVPAIDEVQALLAR